MRLATGTHGTGESPADTVTESAAHEGYAALGSVFGSVQLLLCYFRCEDVNMLACVSAGACLIVGAQILDGPEARVEG